MAYEIDNNVAFNPNKRSGRQSKVFELPFEKLSVGQSFHIPTTENNQKEEGSKISAWCQIAAKKLERRFSMRSVDASDPRGPGIRVWRIENKGAGLDSLFSAHEPKASAKEPQAQKVSASKGRKRQLEPEPQPSRRQRRAEARSFQPAV